MSETDVTYTTQLPPEYVQDLEQALFERIYGTPGDDNVLTGGLIDDPTLFQIPDYEQAERTALERAVTGAFDTGAERQEFFDRYLPYFQDEQGNVRYIPEAGQQLGAGAATISDLLSDTGEFQTAQDYIASGRGGTGVGSIYDDALRGVSGKIERGTQGFDAARRASSLLGEGRRTLRGGLGQYDVSGGLADARENIERAGRGQFGAREAFERGTGRAFELAEQGLGSFDPRAATEEFMDPYKEQVIDAALDRINREGAKRRQAGAAQAVGAGAFGGSRAGVQAAETERAIEETKQSTVANLMSQGYDRAMANAMATDEAARKRALEASGLTGQLGSAGASLESRAFEDAAQRGLAAATTSAGLSQAEEQMRQQAFEEARRRALSAGQELGRLSGVQLGAESESFESRENRMLKAADMYRSMGLSEAEARARASEDEKKRNLEAGRLVGGIGQTMGQLGGAQADIGQAYGSLAGQSADIGRLYAGLQPADMGFMYELGGKERQYSQEGLDFARLNQLNTTQQALAPYSYAQTFLTGSPSASMYSQFTQTPTTQANPFLQGVGAYSSLQGMNQ